MNGSDDSLLTGPEAAAELGVHRDTARRAAADGQVPGARQIAGAWVATRAAWETWFKNRRPAGRPRREDAHVEMRDLGNGFSAIIEAYRVQPTSSYQGATSYDPAQRIEVVRDYGTRRQSVWAETLVRASSEWDPQAVNQMGRPGAYRNVRPSAEKIDGAIAAALATAEAAWLEAQNRIYVIVADDIPIGMVRTPNERWAVEDATAAGLLLSPARPANGEEHRIQVLALREAWETYCYPDRPEPDDVRALLINLVDRYHLRDADLSMIRFRERVTAITTYEQLRSTAMAAVSWMQGLSSAPPSGVETGDDYRRAVWAPSSPYHPDHPDYVGKGRA